MTSIFLCRVFALLSSPAIVGSERGFGAFFSMLGTNVATAVSATNPSRVRISRWRTSGSSLPSGANLSPADISSGCSRLELHGAHVARRALRPVHAALVFEHEGGTVVYEAFEVLVALFEKPLEGR